MAFFRFGTFAAVCDPLLFAQITARAPGVVVGAGRRQSGLEADVFNKFSIIGVAAAMGLAVSSASLMAQDESTNRVATETDWSVFVEDDPTQCWVVTQPTESVNTRDGNEVQVNRGDILMFVSFWPSQNRMGEVSFTGGYPYPDGHVVTVEIGDDTFEFYTENRDVDGESVGFAWSPSAEDDARLIAAMKRGANAIVTGVSRRDDDARHDLALRVSPRPSRMPRRAVRTDGICQTAVRPICDPDPSRGT
jgi:hypothetical protein